MLSTEQINLQLLLNKLKKIELLQKCKERNIIKCNSKSAADRYRLSEEKAAGIMLSANMQPLEPYINALSKWKCRCLKCKKIITVNTSVFKIKLIK